MPISCRVTGNTPISLRHAEPPAALRLAWRDLRGDIRGLWLVLACLALGSGAIAAVGSLRASFRAGLAAQGRALLGGDVAIGTGAVPPPAALRAFLAARGARTTLSVHLRTLLNAPGGHTLVTLRAVGRHWPLVGQVGLRPDLPVAAALAGQGLIADRLPVARLGLEPGAQVRLGRARFTLRAVLTNLPDRLASPAFLGAPVLISRRALAATGLVVPGAILGYTLRAVAPHPAALRAALRRRFAAQGWRIRGPDQAAPGAARFITLTSRFMALVGLTTLLMGGIGVASGVSAWLAGRAHTLSVLRCLGAGSGTVLAAVGAEVGLVALAGIGAGVALGALVPALVGWGFGAALPLPSAGGVYPAPLAEAALAGALTAAVFALYPLGRAARTPGAALFRGAALAGEGAAARPGAWVIAAILALAAALAALVLGGSGDLRLAAGFALGVPAALAVFALAGWGLRRVLAALPSPRGAAWRIGLGNLHRPGARVGAMLSAIGLGLATLVAVGQVQGTLRRLVLEALPAHGPSFFFIDLEPAQLSRFRALIAATPGARDLRLVPTLRARIVAVNGVPAAQVKAAPGTGWALRGDRGLTYAAAPPPGTRLVAGRWWRATYRGPPLVSLDARLARGWGVGIGGVIRVNVLGRDVDLRVASLRQIRWQRLGINFVMVASPGLLSAAPQTELGTVRVPPAAEAPLLARVAAAFPNVTPIAVRAVLAEVAGLLRQIAAALAAVGAVTLLAGALVLGGAVAAGQARRRRQAVLLRVLGASGAQIRAAFLIEFAVLGLCAGVLAALVGSLAAAAILRWLMAVPLALAPGWASGSAWGWAAGAVALAGLLVTALGWAGTRRVLRTPPAALLRDG